MENTEILHRVKRIAMASGVEEAKDRYLFMEHYLRNSG